MLAWSTAVIFVGSLLAGGPLRPYEPTWLQSGAELLATISLFILVCAIESGWANPDRTDQGS